MNTKISKILIATSIFLLISVSSVDASSLKPSILDIQIENNEEKKGTLEYINTSDTTNYLKPLILPYDAKNELVIEDGYIFIETESILYEVEPGASVFINYSISFDNEVIEGTYFNVLAMVSQSESDQSNIFELEDAQFNINIGEGSLFAAHVNQVGEINIFQQIEVTLIPSREWFIPYLLPVNATLTIENTSNFVLDIGGELKSVNSEGNTINISRNSEGFTKLYPGDGLEMVTEATINSFEDISFVYTLGENTSSQQQIDIISVQNYSLYVVITFGIFITLAFLFILKRKKKNLV